MNQQHHFINSLSELDDFAIKEAQHRTCDLILLSGDLGSGKTTFSQSFIKFLIPDAGPILSPTFSYLNIYQGHPDIYHFDLYRMENDEEIFDLGLWEYLCDNKAIRLVEWPEIVMPLIRPPYRHITFNIKDDKRWAKTITVQS